VAWGNLRVGTSKLGWPEAGWCGGQRLVWACYSPYRLTTTTGAAVPFRFRRTKNRAWTLCRNRAGRVRMGARTGRVRVREPGRFEPLPWTETGSSLVFCLGGPYPALLTPPPSTINPMT